MTFTYPSKNLYRYITACCWAFCAGFSDGAVGVLLPYIQMQFHLSYSKGALVWLSTSIGYIFVALLANRIHQTLKRTALAVGCLSMVIMAILVSSGVNYPVVVLGFFFSGVGTGIVIAQLNVFVSSFDNSSVALGYFHGIYGLGASVSPLVATAFVEAGIRWHYFYIILAIAVSVCAVNAYFAFAYGEDQLKQFEPPEAIVSAVEAKTLTKEALKNKATWINSLFVLFYQGAEVAMGGWTTTYLRDYRHHTRASIGYVTSGYWFGLTLGRIFLTNAMHRWTGARRGNAILALGAILFVLLTWVIPTLGVEIVTITLSGILIGPIYPLMITYVALEGLIPRKIQVVSLTITSAFGSSGGALFPFIVGLISQFAGAYVLLPSFITMFSIMLVLWLSLPNVAYRGQEKGMAGFIKRIW
ncbi:major facilitator superfamily [Suhomyces tanzawaensis NRRL Y-17324]|uniref:Major facilitator superfamily n=1 Tax=Suhomyces tanzawaensis NRRL Y-17324 TaxID=984487 RepID=A0A1E4SEE9_9ASCO|nr:major facilitator superfamily [Suhomyces tanzawaensis NRRL Y-17324]ODV77850.1 major facilitator superfamily [Suhomyces tanzawaensis NRRL Y-17324]